MDARRGYSGETSKENAIDIVKYLNIIELKTYLNIKY